MLKNNIFFYKNPLPLRKNPCVTEKKDYLMPVREKEFILQQSIIKKGNKSMGKYNPAPYQIDLNHYPNLVSDTIPGPKSNELHARAAQPPQIISAMRPPASISRRCLRGRRQLSVVSL